MLGRTASTEPYHLGRKNSNFLGWAFRRSVGEREIQNFVGELLVFTVSVIYACGKVNQAVKKIK